MHHEEMTVALVGMLCVFGLPFLGLMIWMITHYIYAAFKMWQETALKRDMVARGYTTQEILDVVAAKRSQSRAKTPLADVPPAKPVKQSAYGA